MLRLFSQITAFKNILGRQNGTGEGPEKCNNMVQKMGWLLYSKKEYFSWKDEG
jgi:hypothetical protein